jgi:hypothetical protein
VSPGPPGAVLPSLLASTVTGGGAPGVSPGTGTDGKPMPSDPTLSGPMGMHPGTAQPPGGGVKQAPPAAANGSPAPLMVNLPYLMATAARAGYDPNVVKLLGTSWINGQIASGAMDKATGERFLSGAGDSAPLNATTQITTTGMNNATTLANTRLQGQNQIAATRAGQVMVANDPADPTKGFHWETQGTATDQHMPGYDSGVAQKGMETQPTLNPADPLHPNLTPLSRIIAPGSAYQSPNVDQATADAKIVTIVKPNGDRVGIPYGQYRQDPSVGRLENPNDQGTTNIISPKTGLPAVTSTPQAVAAGAQPMPTGTDQNVAAGAAGVTGTTLNNPPAAGPLSEAVRAGNENIQPKAVLTPDQELRISGMVDQTVQHMYPVPGGLHWSNSSALAAISAEKKAEVMSRVRDLAATTKYRNDPAAAVTFVLQQMQNEGSLPKQVERGLGWFSQTAPYLTGGKDPRFIVDQAPSTSEPTPGPKSLVDTVAPKKAGPRAPTTPPVDPKAVPPGAVGVAPAGAADGTILRAKNGTSGVVRGGFVFPAPGTAGQ